MLCRTTTTHALLVGALLAGCHNMGDFSASDAITIARTGSFELETSPEEALGWTSKIERCRRAAALSDGDSVYLRQIPEHRKISRRHQRNRRSRKRPGYQGRLPPPLLGPHGSGLCTGSELD